MAGEHSRVALNGVRVLLVHENAFQGQYLADVIADAGATLVGPIVSARQAIASLEHDGPWSALVLSSGVDGGGAVAGIGAELGVALLYVQSAPSAASPPPSARRVMSTPFAGFQVVEALGEMMVDHGPAAGPHLGGH